MTRYRLEFTDGQVIETEGYGIIGRNPGMHPLGEEVDYFKDASLITIKDSSKSVSRMHVAFGQYEGTLWVTDLGSGNGTTIAYPDGGTFPCEPGTRYEVDPGSVVTFGNFAFVAKLG
jgi:hypothetical protein